LIQTLELNFLPRMKRKLYLTIKVAIEIRFVIPEK
jgi:hypothetical protein